MFRELWYVLCTSCKPHPSRTVRYAFPFVLVALLVASAAAVSTSGKSFITITATPESVRQGDAFFIHVRATAHTPVNAVDIVVSYPEEQMRITGIDTGESVLSLWTEEPYAENGKVYLRGGTFKRGFLGEHLIVRIRAEAIESGTAYVTKNTATFIAGDGQGTEVAVTDSDRDESKIYIQNADGSLVGEASLHIITDLDGDGKVGLSDISAFMLAWFDSGTTFDFDGDGKMTFRDFSILLSDSFFR